MIIKMTPNFNIDETWFKQHVQSDFTDTNSLKAAVKKFMELNDSELAVTDNLGQTGLHSAAKLGFDVFIEKCSEFYGERFSNFLTATTRVGNTPLHLAALEGNYSVVEILMESGANPNVINNRKMTPLSLAAAKDSSKESRLKIIELLLIKTNDMYLESDLLWKLTSFCNKNLIEIVLQKSPNLIETLDDRRQNILHHAILNQNLELVKYFCMQDSLMLHRADNGSTALILATRYGSPEIVQALLTEKSVLCQTSDYLLIKDEHRKTALDYLQEKINAPVDNNKQSYQDLLSKFPGYPPEPSITTTFRM